MSRQPELRPGQRIGGYELLSRVSLGAVKTVYQARKPPHEERLTLTTWPRPQDLTAYAARLERAARLSEQLEHPNLLEVRDFGEERGLCFLVTQLVDGQSLARRLRDGGRLPVGEAAAIISRVARALEALHQRGFVHREVNPHNIFLGRLGEILLADFGLIERSLTLEGQPASALSTKEGPVDPPSAGLGSSAYLAPEQVRGSVELDPRSDLFSLGAVLYRMLTGVTPSANSQPPRQAHSGHRSIPPFIDGVIAHMMAPDRERRIASARAVRAALDKHRQPRGESRPPTAQARRPDRRAPPALATPSSTRGDATGEPSPSAPTAPDRPALPDEPISTVSLNLRFSEEAPQHHSPAATRPATGDTDTATVNFRDSLGSSAVFSRPERPPLVQPSGSPLPASSSVTPELPQGQPGIGSAPTLPAPHPLSGAPIERAKNPQRSAAAAADETISPYRARVSAWRGHEPAGSDHAPPPDEGDEPIARDPRRIARKLGTCLALITLLGLATLTTRRLYDELGPRSVTLKLECDRPAPWCKRRSLELTGRLIPGDASLTAAGVALVTSRDGSFHARIPLQEGLNRIDLRAERPDDRVIERRFELRVDTIEPQLSFHGELDGGRLILERGQALEGAAKDSNLSAIDVDSEPISFGQNGEFELSLAKLEGTRSYAFSARDQAGNVTRRRINVTVLPPLDFASVSATPSDTKLPELQIAGRLNRAGVPVWLGQYQGKTDERGLFKFVASLAEGRNELVLKARGEQGAAERTFVVWRDSVAPVIEVSKARSDGRLYLATDRLIEGQVREPKLVSLSAAGRPIPVDSTGRFAHRLEFEAEPHRLTLEARDRAGNRAKIELKVFSPRHLDFELSRPLPKIAHRQSLTISGRASRGPVTVRIGRRKARSNTAGRFRIRVPLAEGRNVIGIAVEAPDGVRRERSYEVSCDTRPPIINLDGEELGARVPVSLTGTLRGRIDEANLVRLEVDGQPVVTERSGRFEVKLTQLDAPREIEIGAEDRVGRRSQRVVLVGTKKALVELGVIAVLNDSKLWSRASSELQDLAIARAHRQLSKSYDHIETKTYRCGEDYQRLASFAHRQTGIVMHLLPGGEYLMGARDSDPSEGPRHEVRLPPFLISRSEVRQSEWDRVHGDDTRAWRDATRPIEGVSWSAAKSWLGRADGRLRLPSESEWEYACRAGSTTRYFWGNVWDPSYAWYRGNSAAGEDKVARPRAAEGPPQRSNAFGLVDMLGNVAEWCEDDYLGDYADGPIDGRPRGDGTGPQRVLRGGSYASDISSCRSYARFRHAPNHQSAGIGLRVARALRWPEPRASWKAARSARSRRVGLEALLNSRERWQNATIEQQDKAIALTSKKLSERFVYVKTQDFECGGQRNRIAVYKHHPTGILMHLVPGGSYLMGSDTAEDTQPVHAVRVKPFLIARSETQQQTWDHYQGSDARTWPGAALPIEGVSWDQVKDWLDDSEAALRLPSEAEWEYAARAGTSGLYFWGRDWREEFCWFRDNSDQNASREQKTHPGAEHRRRSNAFGLIDVLGNVKEWCEDDYFKSYATGPKDERPRASKRGEYRVARGGSWFTRRDACEVSRRHKYATDHRFKDLGFRLASSIPD